MAEVVRVSLYTMKCNLKIYTHFCLNILFSTCMLIRRALRHMTPPVALHVSMFSALYTGSCCDRLAL